MTLLNAEPPWILVSDTIEALPALIRLRTDLGSTALKARLQWLAKVVWTYSSVDDSLLPTDEQFKGMAAFENEFVPRLENADIGLLCVITTHKRQRQWYFYVTSIEEFMNLLDTVPENGLSFPIRVNRRAEPDWSFYKATVEQYAT